MLVLFTFYLVQSSLESFGIDIIMTKIEVQRDLSTELIGTKLQDLNPGWWLKHCHIQGWRQTFKLHSVQVHKDWFPPPSICRLMMTDRDNLISLIRKKFKTSKLCKASAGYMGA